MPAAHKARAVIASVDERSTVVRIAQGRLRRSAYHTIRAITCEFHEGVLTLRGRVSSYYLKQVAQEVVRTVDRVSEINNRVGVDPPEQSLPPEEERQPR
jgi:osmotically-inducible protein OsmY